MIIIQSSVESYEHDISWLDRSAAVHASDCLSFVFGKDGVTQLNFTLQWMARQTKEEKITYRIRNIHFKVLLYGFVGIRNVIQHYLAAICYKEAYFKRWWVGASCWWSSSFTIWTSRTPMPRREHWLIVATMHCWWFGWSESLSITQSQGDLLYVVWVLLDVYMLW